MPSVFDYPHTVRPEEIDELGHANNTAYVAWMQAAATAHSEAQGWPADRYRRLGHGWVVRSHAIDYLLPAYSGDRIVVRTWVASMKKATSLRRYRMLRAADEAVLAVAETKWAFVGYATGQPMRIPAEIAGAFVVVQQAP